MQTQAGQVSVIVSTSPLPNKVESYPCKAAIRLGICQIVLGVLILFLSITAMVKHSYVTNVITNRIFFIQAGSFQVTSGKINTRCWIVTSMIFGILAALFASYAIIVLSIGIAISDDEDLDEELASGRYIMNGLLVFLAFVEFVIAITAAAMSCRPICCARKILQEGIIVSPQAHFVAQPGQDVTYPNQQAFPIAPPGYTSQAASAAPPTYSYQPSEETKTVPSD